MRIQLLVASAALALSACSPAARGAMESVSPEAALSPSASPTAEATASDSATAPSTPSVVAQGVPSASSAPPSGPFSDPAPVGSFVLGDSISLSPEVGPVLGKYGYQVVGRVGQSVTDAYLTTYLSSREAQRAPGWVIVLGTNNGGTEADVARLAHWVDLIDSLRTPGLRQRVRWVTPYRPADQSMQTSELDAFNAELARLAAERPWLQLLDFATLAKSNPEWFDEDPALRVHPNSDGQAAVVALIAGTDPVAVPNPLYPSDAAPAPQPVQEPASDPAVDNGALEEDFEDAAPSPAAPTPPIDPPAEPSAEPTPTPSPEPSANPASAPAG